MAKTVVGLFDDHAHAQAAVRDLLDRKFVTEKISIVTSDPRGEFNKETIDHHGNKSGEGALTGATSGALIGGVLGLLVGVGVLAFPALGLVVAGPLAGALTGAGIGAVSGGLLGALIGMGIPEEHAHTYAEAVRRGSVLVTVEVDEADFDRAHEVMRKHKAVDVKERAEYYRQQGFHQYDTKAKPYTEPEIVTERESLRNYFGAVGHGTGDRVTGNQVTGTQPMHPAGQTPMPPVSPQPMNPAAQPYTQPTPPQPMHDAGQTYTPPPVTSSGMPQDSGQAYNAPMSNQNMPPMEIPTAPQQPQQQQVDLPSIYQAQFASRGISYPQFEEGYRFGQDLPQDPRYASDWTTHEEEIRREWEAGKPGSWEFYRDVVYAGWAAARARSHGARLM